MTTPDDALQVRDQPGRQVRARQLSREVAAVIRSAHLFACGSGPRPGSSRDGLCHGPPREDLAGANDYLTRQARSLSTPTRLGPTLRRHRSPLRPPSDPLMATAAENLVQDRADGCGSAR